MFVTFPIVKLDAIGYFFDDEESIALYEQEKALIFEIWRDFLTSSLLNQGIGFKHGCFGIEILSKGIEDAEKIRYSSFLKFEDGHYEAVLHHEYALNEIDDLIQEHLICMSKDENLFQIYINTPNRMEML